MKIQINHHSIDIPDEALHQLSNVNFKLAIPGPDGVDHVEFSFDTALALPTDMIVGEPMTSRIEPLPEGVYARGFGVMSIPLPKDHWLYDEAPSEPPMPQRIGAGTVRSELTPGLMAAGRYALRAATNNGKDMDFDPDALIQNLIIGYLGYHTVDGLSHADEDFDPEVEEAHNG